MTAQDISYESFQVDINLDRNSYQLHSQESHSMFVLLVQLTCHNLVFFEQQ